MMLNLRSLNLFEADQPSCFFQDNLLDYLYVGIHTVYVTDVQTTTFIFTFVLIAKGCVTLLKFFRLTILNY